MKMQASIHWFTGFATILLASSASAFVAPQVTLESLQPTSVKIGIRTLRPTLQASAEESLTALSAAGEAAVKVDSLSGAPRLISGAPLLYTTVLESSASAAGPESYIAAAHQYVAEHAQTLGVTAADLKLNKNATMIANDVQFISFKVLRGGIEVQDASLDFRFKKGNLVQVANRSFSEAKLDERATQGNLQAVVHSELNPSQVAAGRELYRVVPAGHGYKLVRVQEFNTIVGSAAGHDRQLMVVEVESATGKMFEIRPTRFELDGSAKGDVYPRTYYQQSASVMPYRDLKLSYDGGSAITDADGLFKGAPDTAQPALNGFEGTRVKVVPQTGDLVTLSGTAEGNGWAVSFKAPGEASGAEDKAMAQSMTYYHLNKEIQHAKLYINPAWFDQQLTANVNLDQHCNAYWDGATVNLFSAGSGCANTALISDVFYHEWGHGLHANTSGIEDRAYSEGYADTCALLMTQSNQVGPGFKTSGAPVRDLTTMKIYPQDANIEIHQEGLIVAGSFYETFQSFVTTYGKDKATDILSNMVLKVISTTHAYTDVYDALLVIDNTSGNLADVSPNLCAINKAFAHHGLAQADSRCGG